MCRETTEETMTAIHALKATITYLKENTISIVDELLEKLLNSKKVYLYSLKEDATYNEFRDSLIEGHFKWMIDYSYNPDETQVSFSGDYTIEDVQSLSLAYCNFYSLFSNYIAEIDEPIEVQENLEDYCTYLSSIYCT